MCVGPNITLGMNSLPEDLKPDGNAVVIDGLGRFRLMVESEGVEKASDFNIARHIRRIVCKFLPAAHRIGDDREVKSTGRREQLFSEGADVEWYH